MGLDMTVMIESEQTTNSKGQIEWKTTMIGNLRNCWEMLESLGIENCTTKAFSGDELNEIVESLENENEKEFIKEEVKFEDDKTYLIHVWY